MPAVKTRTAPALYNALTILDLLTSSRGGLTLPDIVEQSHLARSSVHYLLVTLERCGYVRRSERTGRYMLGVKLFNMANASLGNLSLRQRAASYLSYLNMSTELTVHMAIFQQQEAILIARKEPSRGQRLSGWIGRRMALHCTGIGKAILAYLPKQEIDAIICKNGLARHNENTIATPRRLYDELAHVVRNGYALDNEEDEIGVRCIGVPILDATTGQPVAAISLAGSIHDIPLDGVKQLASELQRTARMMAHAFADCTPFDAPPASLASIAS